MIKNNQHKKEAEMMERGIGLWKKAIEKLNQNEAEEARRQLAAEQAEAEAKAKKEAIEKAQKEKLEEQIRAVEIELGQFLKGRGCAYIKELCRRKSGFLSLAITKDERRVWGFSEDGFFRGTPMEYKIGYAGVGLFTGYGGENRWWFTKDECSADEIIRALIGRKLYVEQIIGYIYSCFDALAKEILKK